MKVSLYITLIACFVSMFLVTLDVFPENYTVKTVYFIPKDAKDKLNELPLGEIMKDIQRVYRQEMDEHGFPDKTFRLEMDNDEVVIHKVHGKFNKAHYFAKTSDNVPEELKPGFPNWEKNIFAVVVAGLDSLQNGISAGVARAGPGGWWIEGKDHGFAFSMEADAQFVRRILMHELAHTFGLWHIRTGDPVLDYILGNGENLYLHEARWLSKSHYFNKGWRFSIAPEVLRFHKIESIKDDKVRFKWDISDPDSLHQAYFFFNSNILGWNFLHGNRGTAILEINRDWIPSKEIIWLQLMDGNGNWIWSHYQYTLPEPIDEGDPSKKNPDLGEEDEPVDDTRDPAKSVKPQHKLTTLWAKVKYQR